MKTNKNTLKKIIQEEVGRYLNENTAGSVYVVVSGYYRELEGVFSDLRSAQTFVQSEGRGTAQYEIYQMPLNQGVGIMGGKKISPR